MPVRLGIGVGRFIFDDVAGFRAWVDTCEEGRIDSIWQSDRVISKETFHEPLSLLAVVAGATRRLKIGMNAVVIGFRDPVTFARQCASIDHLSEGRLLPVIGVGQGGSDAWKATGRSPDKRGSRANEALEIITRLWSEEKVSFEGDYLRVSEATISPRPVQQPMPLWVGGASAAAVRRTVRYGTGWLAGLQDVQGATDTAAAIRDEARKQGRKIPADHYGATLLYRIESRTSQASRTATPAPLAAGASKLVVAGEPGAILNRIRDYVAGGISKFVAIPVSSSQADLMEQTRLLESEVIPEASRLEMPSFE